MAAELHLSFSEVGLLKGVFSGAMGLFQVPMSLLGERIGELTVIGSGTLGLTGGFLLLSLAGAFPAVLLSLALAKGTGAGQHGLSSSVLSKVFEHSGRRAAMGTFNFAGDVGKVTLPFILALLISLMPWRTAVMTLSVCGIAAGAVLWTVARNTGTGGQEPRVVEKKATEGSRWGIRDRKSFSALLTIGIIDISTRTALAHLSPVPALR